MIQTVQPETRDRRAHVIDVVPLGAMLGAEIRGLDLTGNINHARFEALHDALMTHKVLVFRDQDISSGQHLAFGRMFGEVSVHPFVPHLPDLPEMIELDNHADNPVLSTDMWHSDETFRDEPPMGSILRCREMPTVGGDTMWADMTAVLAGLSDKMRSFLSGLEAVHDFKPFRRRFAGLPVKERHARLAEFEELYPNPTHPVITTHPVTGDKVLFVNEQFTLAIKDMREDESRNLLDFLFTLPRIPEYQFRLSWEKNTIAFWDNRPTQHYAANDYFPQRRTMHRITIRGVRPS
ncbi:MAG: TauD/TfdA family dioxygenase [Pseudomonadota bacterium]|nr:TauD/TfdA family dioxygenase [Pseudomonadota bacterium]